MKHAPSALASAVIVGTTVLLASSCSSGSGTGFGNFGSDGSTEVTASSGGSGSSQSTSGSAGNNGSSSSSADTSSGSHTSSGANASSGASSSATASSTSSSSGGGTGSGASSGNACSDAGVNTCGATSAAGAVSLSDYYLGSLAMGGYAFSYADSEGGNGGTSTICLRTDTFCAKGSTGTNANPSKDYGAGIGITLNQAQAPACTSGAISAYSVPSSSVGLSYKVSNLPVGGLRLSIGNTDSTTNTGTDYCVTLSAASGTIPWSSFNSKCWDPSTGTSLSGPPSQPTHIEFQLPSSPTAEPFDFCVDSLAFATSLDGGGGGTDTIGTACTGNACCEPGNGPNASNGELTCYTFQQGGSAPIGTNLYKSYCGYTISEASGGGNGGVCGSGDLNYTDTVTGSNIGTNPQYFVAFPTGNGGWGNGAYCGMCVNISYQGQTVMATVVDECPTGSCPNNGGHLDLNAALARALGLGTGNAGGDATNGVSWKAVECPVTGGIQVLWQSGQPNSQEVYFQNVVWPVKSVTGGSCGNGCTQTNGYWSPINLGTTVTITDILGHQITATITGGDIDQQFPGSCN